MAAGGFDVLGSLLDGRSSERDTLADSVRRRGAALSEGKREALREILYADLFSEFDARYLSEYLRERSLPCTAHFWACEERWARDEELHYLGFRAIYAALFDRDEEELGRELEGRRAAVDFEPIAHLFRDEHSIACLLAYDELATVRAYRSSYSSYRLLGPNVMAFVHKVTADEGRHFRNFMKLLRQEHGHRLGEVDRVIDAIRDREGQAYGNNFVHDHDDGVWNDTIFDESADILRRRLHV